MGGGGAGHMYNSLPRIILTCWALDYPNCKHSWDRDKCFSNSIVI